MRTGVKVAIGSIGLVLVLGGAAGGIGLYERRVLEVQAAELALSWPSIDFYFFYKLFMSWANSGVRGPNNLALPAALKTKLKPHYSFDLGVARYAYTASFSDLAITDCTKIYFGNKPIVDAVSLDRPLSLSQVGWLAHELAHVEQCQKWGGRKNYANTWFRQLTKEVLSLILRGKFSSVVQSVSQAQTAVIHDSMSMEKEASQRAAAVVAAWK